jgi:hypothetical protein
MTEEDPEDVLSYINKYLDQKVPGSFEMWCRRRMKKSAGQIHVRNEEV